MLNFSKINIFIIYFIFFVVSIFSFLNFQNKNNPILDKKVNLGLDLQGGSYLLLEINSDSLVEEKIQSKVIPIKKLLKENNIKFNDFKINNSSLNFTIDDLDKFELVFFSKKDNLVDAQPSIQNQQNEPTVSFTLDRLGAQKFGRATTDNVGKRLAIVLDGKVISAPNINEPITSGNGVISGNFSFQEATDLSLLLRSGALPTPLDIVEERTVGPDLGEDSIKSGITSLIVGFILVILFMFYKYKLFGLIANTALIANLLMLVGVLTILEATLTLPGIAGIILTVGMAVDANVLIFERIKEELKTEKSIIHAFDTGYSKAKITVLDANITTLIAAIILFAFGSGPVKGFAITLGIGIITTLFTAYFLARHLTSIIVLRNNNKEMKI